MKTMFNSNFIKTWSLVACMALGATLSAPVVQKAQAQVYYTVQQLLADQFKGSQRVSFKRVDVGDALRGRLEREAGVKLPKGKYTFYVASSEGHVDGYALFDEERGQHEMIGFATFFDAKGAVTRVEVTAFREPHGDGVRAAQFRKQFVGRTARSGFSPNSDIDAISGATISSRALCKGVRRAAALLDATLLGDTTLAQR